MADVSAPPSSARETRTPVKSSTESGPVTYANEHELGTTDGAELAKREEVRALVQVDEPRGVLRRDEVTMTARLGPQNAKAILGVVEGDPLDEAG